MFESWRAQKTTDFNTSKTISPSYVDTYATNIQCIVWPATANRFTCVCDDGIYALAERVHDGQKKNEEQQQSNRYDNTN